MSFGSKSSSSSQQNTVDPWSKQQYTNLSGQVQNTLNGGYGSSYTPYTSPMTAGQTSLQTQANQLGQNNVGAGSGAVSQGVTTADAAAGYQPSQVQAGMLNGMDLSGYMNPYIQSVLDTSNQQIDLQRQRDINSNAGQSVAAGAFGGSRQGVADALTNEAYGRLQDQNTANILNQGYTNAQGSALQDIANNLGAQEANQNAGLQGANLNLNAGSLLGSLGQTQQQMGGNDAILLSNLGGQQQQTNQNYLTNLYNEFLRGQINPSQQLQGQLGLLGETPMTTDSTGKSTTTSAGFGLSGALPFMSGIKLGG